MIHYIFIGRDYDRGIPAKVVKEIVEPCHNEEELFEEILKRPKGFNVYLVEREIDYDWALKQAKEYQARKEGGKEYAEYQRLKAKFEGK